MDFQIYILIDGHFHFQTVKKIGHHLHHRHMRIHSVR